MTLLCRRLQDEAADTQRSLRRELEQVQFEKDLVERQKSQLSSELTVALETIAGLKSSVAMLTTSQATVNAELAATKVIAMIYYDIVIDIICVYVYEYL